ncbi:MAG: NAD(+) synthase [Candidatus Levybacteria bacterium]|nr:NAD(+) synthase [Candidatus Levybacteria bacterium]
MKTDPKKETERIIAFLKKTFAEQKIKNAVIGLSGGIDSAVSFLLLKRAIPEKNIFPISLAYFSPYVAIPKKNYDLSIKEAVDACVQNLGVSRNDNVRIGNIMARVRMIFLYDLAKKNKALVVGTENKSEHLLGYFTRFGDSASDIEPIQHLYKTQVYELAKYLNVPQEIINIPPTAGLWQGQTDEEEFGFTYEEADQVLYYYFEQKLPIEEIVKKELINAKKVIKRVKENEYKHKTPYVLEV